MKQKPNEAITISVPVSRVILSGATIFSAGIFGYLEYWWLFGIGLTLGAMSCHNFYNEMLKRYIKKGFDNTEFLLHSKHKEIRDMTITTDLIQKCGMIKRRVRSSIYNYIVCVLGLIGAVISIMFGSWRNYGACLLVTLGFYFMGYYETQRYTILRRFDMLDQAIRSRCEKE